MQIYKSPYIKRRPIKLPDRQTIVIPAIWKKFNIPAPIPEYQFCIERKWRIDYAWPEIAIALEIEGGIWSKGRHITPRGFLKDMEKYNKMAENGWLLLRYEPNNINFLQVKKTIEINKNRFK